MLLRLSYLARASGRRSRYGTVGVVVVIVDGRAAGVGTSFELRGKIMAGRK
jgi:hypothetical protein